MERPQLILELRFNRAYQQRERRAYACYAFVGVRADCTVGCCPVCVARLPANHGSATSVPERREDSR